MTNDPFDQIMGENFPGGVDVSASTEEYNAREHGTVAGWEMGTEAHGFPPPKAEAVYSSGSESSSDGHSNPPVDAQERLSFRKIIIWLLILSVVGVALAIGGVLIRTEQAEINARQDARLEFHDQVLFGSNGVMTRLSNIEGSLEGYESWKSDVMAQVTGNTARLEELSAKQDLTEAEFTELQQLAQQTSTELDLVEVRMDIAEGYIQSISAGARTQAENLRLVGDLSEATANQVGDLAESQEALEVAQLDMQTELDELGAPELQLEPELQRDLNQLPPSTTLYSLADDKQSYELILDGPFPGEPPVTGEQILTGVKYEEEIGEPSQSLWGTIGNVLESAVPRWDGDGSTFYIHGAVQYEAVVANILNNSELNSSAQPTVILTEPTVVDAASRDGLMGEGFDWSEEVKQEYIRHAQGNLWLIDCAKLEIQEQLVARGMGAYAFSWPEGPPGELCLG